VLGALDGLTYGFSVCCTFTNLLAVMLGALIGTIVGVMPGIGPVGAMAMLLPVTLTMGPTAAMIMLAGIYYGAQYGGSTTAILMNVPGEASSVVTCIDGYQMARKGRAGAALSIAAVGSFIAGTLGVAGLTIFAPTLAKAALSFGPPEYCAMAILGLFTLSRIGGGSFWQSLISLSIGLMIATVGMDPIAGTPRFTFGSLRLIQGIEVVPVVMGLFGIAEIFSMAEEVCGPSEIMKVKIKELFPTRAEWKRSLGAMFRGGGIGFIMGILPGAYPLTTFASYSIEHRLSKHPEEFGKGAVEGLAGPESANNAATAGALVPLMSLGIPFSASTALILAALVIQGVQPGPFLISEHPDVFWGVLASMYLGNIAMLILNLPLVGIWVWLLRIPQSVLVALVGVLCLIGVYSVNSSVVDLAVMLMMGAVGYIFKKANFPVVPLVVGLILGSMLEASFRQSLLMGRGNLFIFLQRPVSGSLLIALILILATPVIWRFVKKRQALR